MCNKCRDFNFDTDIRTDGRTDRVTYRDATHLKICQLNSYTLDCLIHRNEPQQTAVHLGKV